MTVRLFPHEPSPHARERDKPSLCTCWGRGVASGGSMSAPEVEVASGQEFNDWLEGRARDLEAELEGIRRLRACIPATLPPDVAQNLAHIFYRASQPQRYDG